MTIHNIFDLGQKHETPVGASFAPGAWVGCFAGAHVYAVGWVEMNLAQLAKDVDAGLTTALEEIDEESGKTWLELLQVDDQMADETKESRSGKFKYYFHDYDRACACARLLDAEEPAYSRGGKKFSRRPEHRFRLEATLDSILTLTDEQKEKFESQVIVWEVELKAIQKNSPHWFDWHGLTMPSIVSAYAQLMGWEADTLDLSELIVPELVVTDKFQSEMVGNTDVGYDGSKLWLRRKLLWGQLGEDDAKVSDPDKTESEKLQAALQVATSDWRTPVWLKALQVESPKVDDVWEGESGRVRSRIPVVLEFYKNESDAKAAAEAELASRGAGDESNSQANGSGPKVPAEWAQIPEDWKSTVKGIKEQIGKVPPPVRKNKLAGMDIEANYAATVQDVMDWWDEV